ncbi:unnamed protein product [Adineta ricciae]|uniref:G-protein coupled receptors family 1 profile domain-containing protein n=1 Tax=Adineta ricciae TaxID=249248 RepID=A0A814U5A1_ADIRI|nr:unnamed protein product [Adineta ricciae]
MSANGTSLHIYFLNVIVIDLFKYVQPIFFIIGNLGNLLTALVFWRKTWRKNVCVFYFKIYLISTTCYINSSLFGSIFTTGYVIRSHDSNIILCKLYFYTAFLFAIHPPTILILACIDRLLISSRNVETRMYSSKRLAYFSVTLGTIFWVVFNVHILIMVHIQEIRPSVFICYYDLSYGYQNFVYYYLPIVNISFCLIMIILCSVSFKNVRHIRLVSRQRRNQERTMTKKDFQLLHCLFAHGVTYVIFRIGINISYGYDAITRGQARTATQQAIETFVNNFLVLLFNSWYCISIFIYVGISKAFRYELKKMLYKTCGIEVLPLREEENRQEKIGADAGPAENGTFPSK